MAEIRRYPAATPSCIFLGPAAADMPYGEADGAA